MSTPQTTLQVTFVSESASYQNTFGWYNKVTGVGGVLFADVEAEGRLPSWIVTRERLVILVTLDLE